MKMDNNKRRVKRLKEERKKRFDEAARKLLEDDDFIAAKKDLDWIDASSKLLFSTQRVHQIKWTMIIAASCILVVVLLASLRLPGTNIKMDILTENVRLVLRKDWIFERRIPSRRIIIDNVKNIDAPGFNIQKTDIFEKEPAMIILKGDQIYLDKLELQANAEIEIRPKKDEIQFFVKDGVFTVKLLVQQAEMIIETGGKRENRKINSEIPESIVFKTKAAGAVPVLLRITTHEAWQLNNMHVQDVTFLEEYISGSGDFRSSICSGEITLLDTGFNKNLSKYDYLNLEKVKSRWLILKKEGNSINVLLEGSAASISTGVQFFEKNITPTIIEYIYNREPLAIFWGAVVFLFGILWRISQMFFDKIRK